MCLTGKMFAQAPEGAPPGRVYTCTAAAVSKYKTATTFILIIDSDFQQETEQAVWFCLRMSSEPAAN